MIRLFKFEGNVGSVYADGVFTIGKVYSTDHVDNYGGNGPEPDAYFIDDDGYGMHEELQYFKEVIDGVG